MAENFFLRGGVTLLRKFKMLMFLPLPPGKGLKMLARLSSFHFCIRNLSQGPISKTQKIILKNMGGDHPPSPPTTKNPECVSVGVLSFDVFFKYFKVLRWPRVYDGALATVF